MQPNMLAFACTLLFLSAPGFSQVTQIGIDAPASATTTKAELAPLTLPEALARASLANPGLRAKQAQLAAAEGLNTDARSLLFNRKPGSSKTLINQRLIGVFIKRVIFRVITPKVT